MSLPQVFGEVTKQCHPRDRASLSHPAAIRDPSSQGKDPLLPFIPRTGHPKTTPPPLPLWGTPRPLSTTIRDPAVTHPPQHRDPLCHSPHGMGAPTPPLAAPRDPHARTPHTPPAPHRLSTVWEPHTENSPHPSGPSRAAPNRHRDNSSVPTRPRGWLPGLSAAESPP